MSTFTKEDLITEINYNLEHCYCSEKTKRLMEIALASLEAEAVAYADPQAFHNFSVYRAGETDNKRMGREWMWANPDAGLIPVYTAPTAPVSVKIPPEKPHTEGPLADGWNACRAAMLKHSEPFIVTSDHRMMEMPQVEAINAVTAMLQGAGGNTPVIPDSWVMVPRMLTPRMITKLQQKTEIGSYIAANWAGAYDLFQKFWDEAIAAAPQQEAK